MIKKLLSAALFAVFALGASAYEVGEYVYTRTAKYHVLGANLVQNGKFNQGATGVDGWTSQSAEVGVDEVFEMKEGGPNGSNSLAVIDGMNAVTNGMYQVIPVDQGGTYVLSFKIIGTTDGFTDIDMNGPSTNYINFYYNTDGTLAISRTEFGENGTGGLRNEFSYVAEGFTEVSLSVDAPADGNLIIDLRALATGVEVADFECHHAEEVYDDRIVARRLAYINTILSAMDFSDREYFEDLQYAVSDVEQGVKDNASPEDMEVFMGNLDAVWAEFLAVNFGNIIDFVPTTDGSPATGNNSANWMQWGSKYSKLINDYRGKAPWSWSNDRWTHNPGAIDTPIGVNWQRGAGGSYNNIATLTVTLKPGVYFWGLSGSGGSMSRKNKSWDASMARETAETRLFFDNDTTEAFVLSPLFIKDYVFQFAVEGSEAKEVKLGVICNPNVDQKEGFTIALYSPVLYKLLEDGELTPEDELNITTFKAQLAALNKSLDKAKAYLAEDQVLLPWGKDTLQLGVDTTQVRYDEWAAMDTMAIVDAYAEGINLADTITSHGVRYLENSYIRKFENINVPLTDMPGAIATATETKGQRIYSGSALMAELGAKIAEAQTLYDTSLKVEYSEEAVLALRNMKADLAALVADFQKAIPTSTIVDINFGTTDAPATIAEDVDTLGMPIRYIDGVAGRMYFPTVEPPFELGYNGTDSIGILRVGNGEAYVDFEGAPTSETNIINVQFDYYAGNLSKSNAGYKLLSQEHANEFDRLVRDTICGIYYASYNGTVVFNTFDINLANMTGVGSGSQSNPAIAAESNRTHYSIVLDYGTKTMYCTTSGAKGVFSTKEIPMRDLNAGRFVIYSQYGNGDRRCWFDNLLVQEITAGVPDGIEEIHTAGVTTKNIAIYNLAGQRMAAPVKGQIYIQNGKKYIGK